ncbi:NUDIX domain-containing protein [Streptomyces sp. NPDC047829]|uniref:NUDIX hydrolase n=1 Tax=Streptomyces sp. NPDC047829 TaxID=3154609 RepID=UPI0033F23BE8
MSETPPADIVHFFAARTLRLAETAEPPLPRAHQQARDRIWNDKTHGNPGLFDGPVVACAAIEETDDQTLLLHWVRVTYRHYALRWVPGATALPSLFVTVLQPTLEGTLLTGRMAPSTAAPGRWQLPGGSVDVPPPDEHLDETALRRNAQRELAEEVGIDVSADALRLWAVTRGEHGNIGIHYLAPPQASSDLNDSYSAVARAAHAQGMHPEFDKIQYMSSENDLKSLPAPHVDYLASVMRRFTRECPQGRSFTR